MNNKNLFIMNNKANSYLIALMINNQDKNRTKIKLK